VDLGCGSNISQTMGLRAAMHWPILLSLPLLAACGADASGPALRGFAVATAAPTPVPEPSVPQDGQAIGCSCGDSECQCKRADSSGQQSDEDEELERVVLNRTKELSAWWQKQNETTRLMAQSWSGDALNQSMGLWHAGGGHWNAGGPGWHGGGGGFGVGGGGFGVGGGGCVRRVSCGCIGLLGCGCSGRRGCAVWR